LFGRDGHPESVKQAVVGINKLTTIKENRFGWSLHKATEVLFVTATSYISTLNIYCSHNNIWGYNKLFISPPWSSEAPPKSLPFTFRGHLTPVIIDFAHVAQNGVSRTLLCLSFQGAGINDILLVFAVGTWKPAVSMLLTTTYILHGD
jgi:hypothetical protein